MSDVKTLAVCSGTGCSSNRSRAVREALELEIARTGLSDQVNIIATGCQGLCARGPIVVSQPDGILFQGISVEEVPVLVQEYLVKGVPPEKLLYRETEDSGTVPHISEVPFYAKQQLVALANRGVIDPESIDEYIGRDGYAALSKALTSMPPETVIEEVTNSGLRGRGGAGFPTGRKWGFCRAAKGDRKFVICNADEGDPGAFMDRSVVESDPHAVLEGIAIGAYAIGANNAFVYIRGEYPLAVRRLEIAIEQAEQYGLLGDNILGTDFSLDVKINVGAGAFVCGEETSLIASLEGRVPEPRVRPPYPAQSGYLGYPTNINNVETWANVRHIVLNGGEWFREMGTETSKGTKVFSLVGKVNNTGLIEVAMGTTLREIVYDIGGGVPNGKKFKAVQSGGPSGGCLPEDLLDTPVDYESLTKAGAIMGSGGLIVMDEDTCMVEVARYFVSFTQQESCGKCTPCREGTKHMLDILTAITEGRGKEGDIELLEKMARQIKATSLCGLGQTAPNPVLTTIRYFRDEYEAHIHEHRCPARECKPLIKFEVDTDACTGCTVCAKNCPVQCISGERKKPHFVDQDLCIKCGMCFEVCNFDAIRVG